MKKINLKYKKERVVLSDVLPYELPLTFSNRYFYEFLVDFRVQIVDSKLEWCKHSDCVDRVMAILFGLNLGEDVVEHSVKLGGKNVATKVVDPFPDGKGLITIPFIFKIAHKKDQARELTICHPRNQVAIVDFYNRYKELILYYSSISEFSIRKPSKVASFIFQKDKLHRMSLSDGEEMIEEAGKEYENLRSFFVYEKYSNVFKFYESHLFHRCEKRYDKLLKLDLSKCFDSIYTHSLSWAVFGKSAVKENLHRVQGSFADNFDRQMMRLNYNETNGIVIGPEFSRIFAELILQSVDHQLRVAAEGKHDIRHKVDFWIFRYVDDYFVFYSDERVREAIVVELQAILKEFKLALNPAKAETFEKPIITNISIGKSRISELLDQKMSYDFDEFDGSHNLGDDVKKSGSSKKGKIFVRSRNLITQYKTIIKECDVSYSDMMNYSLSIVDRKTRAVIRDYFAIEKDSDSERNVINALLGIVEFAFFIYSVSPRVNFTIKLCSILQSCVIFLKRPGGNHDFKHLVFKAIYDDIQFTLKKNQMSDYMQVETLYLLTVVGELGKEYWLEYSALCSYFGITEDGSGKLVCKWELNYLALTVLLFYMKNKKRYDLVRTFVEEEIRKKFQTRKQLGSKDTELILLFFDTLTCPYISDGLKRELLTEFGVCDSTAQDEMISLRRVWFTKWRGLDVRKELDSKRSQDVY